MQGLFANQDAIMNFGEAREIILAQLKTRVGFELPERQADLLLSAVTGVPCPRLEFESESRITDAQFDYIRRYLDRDRLIPVPLHIGYTEVCGIRILVNSDVLMPGTETERLIEVVGRFLCTLHSPIVFDVGTGSGVLGITLAIQYQQAVIYATDVSQEALNLAGLNIRQHKLHDRIHLLKGRWLEPFGTASPCRSADILMSNPPYVSTEQVQMLPAGFREFAPRLAIDGGSQGLEGHRAIISKAGAHIRAGGHLVLQCDTGQAEDICELVRACAAFEEPSLYNGTCGNPRIVVAKRKQLL